MMMSNIIAALALLLSIYTIYRQWRLDRKIEMKENTPLLKVYLTNTQSPSRNGKPHNTQTLIIENIGETLVTIEDFKISNTSINNIKTPVLMPQNIIGAVIQARNSVSSPYLLTRTEGIEKFLQGNTVVVTCKTGKGKVYNSSFTLSEVKG